MEMKESSCSGLSVPSSCCLRRMRTVVKEWKLSRFSMRSECLLWGARYVFMYLHGPEVRAVENSG